MGFEFGCGDRSLEVGFWICEIRRWRLKMRMWILDIGSSEFGIKRMMVVGISRQRLETGVVSERGGYWNLEFRDERLRRKFRHGSWKCEPKTESARCEMVSDCTLEQGLDL